MKSITRLKLAISLLAVGLSALTEPVIAAPIHPLGANNPTGFGLNNPPAWGRGWRFTVNAPGLEVVDLGAWAPTTGSTYGLVLWDTVTTSAVASTAIVAANKWVYSSVGSTPLVNGRDYIVELYGAGPAESYYFDNVGPGPWEPVGDISYVNMTFCNSCSSVNYPTFALTNYQYGLPDIGYQTVAAGVPEPATLALFGAGLAGLGALRRRRRAKA